MTNSADPLIGKLIDQRYLVAEIIARGGMAMVYLAEDTRLDRSVALKVMHSHLSSDGEFVSRFRREAKHAAGLSHPHLITVYDQGQDGDIVYLAMEYLPSITLRDRLRSGGALTPRDAITVLDGMLQGLAAAHNAYVIHRDVKPENVLLGHNGQVKLSDFGLARAVSTSTTTNTLIGTVGYVSPELVTRGATDARSDIYAVGIMFYELLTGEQPYRDTMPIQVAYRHVHDDVPAPSKLVPGLARDLDELVLWATARDPENRPVDAEALLGELRQVRSTLSDAELDFDPTGSRSLELAPTQAVQRPARRERTASAAHPGPDDARNIPLTATATIGTSKAAGRKSRKKIVALAALLVVLLLGGTTGWYFMAGPGATVAVPANLISETADDAETTLSATGLEAQTREVYDDDIRKGIVVDTSPEEGSRVPKDGSVTLMVSKGPELFAMPDVTGKSLDDAKDDIAGANLAVGKTSETYSEKVEAGLVIKQSVKEGSEERRGTKVDLEVSKGREPIAVPDLAGKSRQEAEQAIDDAGLKPKVTEEFSDSVAKGTVISQEPAATSTLYRGDTVNIAVSKGPEMIDVPDVVGQQEDQARKTLEEAGFKVKVEKILEGYFKTVRSQDPAGGGKAKSGSTVTITVV
ncbi:Stk1 family PASTA domain-containing Ser/Thr kinase [Saxibacter everestensis]|uniref:non-specific serine/threonine protein kinase n=1 Tax=Saxibacter everestensis TaxID=2909229 RepID=A0ABY8QYE4_9MICO|nr:Stk1 family PASTA domain-containing Ser/Thr kinase [Brevibacteriaceae bacterium ZFBP1038]